MLLRTFLLLVLTFVLPAQVVTTSCSNCAAWNEPQPAFQVYGNSYYVGTHGLGSILITSAKGHVLIDGALPESASLIAANVRSLGFRMEDVKLILNTHAHFDHAGGIAELQRLSGAAVAASPWAASVMTKGNVAKDDPQFGSIGGIAKVARVQTIRDGQVLSAGDVRVTAHFTPGHTAGGTSWTWQSCESGRCLNLVYADSLTPVSAKGYRFSDRKGLENGEDFMRGYSFLEHVPCDILITPHPQVSNLWERIDKQGQKRDGFVDSSACRVLAESAAKQLKNRLAEESKHGKQK